MRAIDRLPEKYYQDVEEVVDWITDASDGRLEETVGLWQGVWLWAVESLEEEQESTVNGCATPGVVEPEGSERV